MGVHMLSVVRGNILGKWIQGCPLGQIYGTLFRTETGCLRVHISPWGHGWDAAELREVQRWLEENDDITLFWSSHE